MPLTRSDRATESLPVKFPNQEVLDQAVHRLIQELGENLHSCCVYGSTVRGNAVEGVSDINLLILLKESNTRAHLAVSRAIGSMARVDPFILACRGFERSVQAFAPKFASIRRNYRVLHGPDPLAAMEVDSDLEKFLCEQAVRNLRLRLVYAFVTREQGKSYDRFVVNAVTQLFVHSSEVLRLSGTEIPTSFDARIPILEKQYAVDGAVLRDLLTLKQKPTRFSEAEAVRWHERLFPVVDSVLVWIETHWNPYSK